MKNKRLMRRAVSCLLVLLMMIGMLPVIGVSAATVGSSGMEFSAEDRIVTSAPLSVEPLTFQAEFSLDSSSGGWKGTMFGNFLSKTDTENGVNFDLGWHKSYGAFPRIVYGADTRISFAEIDMRKYAVGTTAQVTIVIERGAGTNGTDMAHCYVYSGGVLKASQSIDGLTIGSLVSPKSYVLGGDNQMADGVYTRSFLGEIKNIKIYSDIRTAEEIAADAVEFSADSTDDALLTAYDLMSDDPYTDLSGKRNDAMDLSAFKYSFDASNVYTLDKELSAEPHTFMATVYLPTGVSKAGSVFGNYKSGVEYIDFGVTADGFPVLSVSTEKEAVANIVFDEVDLKGRVTKIAVTHTDTYAKCYVNGKLVQTVTGDFAYHADALSEADVSIKGRPVVDPNEQYFMLGGGTDNVFGGKIANVALYSEALSAREIDLVLKNGADADVDSVIAYYDLINYTEGFIKDVSGNGNNVSHRNFSRAEALPNYAYSFAIVGDTQRQVKYDYEASTDGNIVTSRTAKYYEWLIQNKDKKNIKYVFGLGDITEYNTDIEWQIAKSQITKLDEAGLPYSLIMGNHDTVEKLDEYFADPSDDFYTSRVSGYYEEGSLGNYYINFEVAGTKYMLLGLEFGADDNVLAWASDVVDANPDRRVIMTTHAYMNADGTTLDDGDYAPPRGGLNNGEDMWNEFVSQHRNIILVLSGHIGSADVIVRQDKGIYGNTVTQMLIDPQSLNVGLNMICMLYFSEDGKDVAVEWIAAGNTLSAQKNDPDAEDIMFRANSRFDLTLIPDEGNGIYKTEYLSSDGLYDTYRIYYTNGTYDEFTVKNGADGQNGQNGLNGENGKDGADGKTPYIGENGNWWIGVEDTGIRADGGVVIAPDYGIELDGGSFGEDMAWSVTDKNVLVISGKGAMKDYTNTVVAPWMAYKDEITSIVIEEGVMSIGNNAFSGMDKVKSVSFPTTLTTIGNYAFYGCSRLESMELPARVRYIGQYAFRKSGVDEVVFRVTENWTVGGEVAENLDLAGVTAQNLVSKMYQSAWELGGVEDGDVLDSGYCGESVIWTMSYNGTLTVTGEGDMDYTRAPWKKYMTVIYKTVIADTVNVKDGAFSGANKLK